MNAACRYLLTLLLLFAVGGCANIVPPGGGKKDVIPPKLLSVTPKDSLLNARVSRLELVFDEYIVLTNASSEVQLSPILPIPINVVANGKKITLKIPDSLLHENTTYRITFGKAIQDLHENNPFSGYSYQFSTGAYFDSLQVEGTAINAATGLLDTAATILLYDAALGDSIVVRSKPSYATHVDAGGHFSLQGLPARKFNLFAVHDANSNLLYDGPPEWVGFLNAPVQLRADSMAPITIRVFSEALDTSKTTTTASGLVRKGGAAIPIKSAAGEVGYSVKVDTTTIVRRTQDITKPLQIVFAHRPDTNFIKTKFLLSYDSAGLESEAPVALRYDTATTSLFLETPWHEDMVYTLRLQKGFAKDSTGAGYLPGRYSFRTQADADYGKLQVHLPTAYYSPGFVLQVVNDVDTVYQKPVTDSIINLLHLPPASYTLRVIKDDNHNGRWDAGNLFKKIQPEIVIPNDVSQLLKAGWDNIIDFKAIDLTRKTTIRRGGNKPADAKAVEKQQGKFNTR